jgi:hypothetical protein
MEKIHQKFQKKKILKRELMEGSSTAILYPSGQSPFTLSHAS